jgi:hypothetical protein
MTYYGHVQDGTIPVGGGSHNEDREGSESSNFKFDQDGGCLGYVYINSGTGAFNLWRIAGSEVGDVDRVDGVLVVSVARHPEYGGQVIVGWHANATCHGYCTDEPRPYVFTARGENSVLLPPEERTCQVPRGEGGMGQFNVCYTRHGDFSRKDAEWIAAALDFIEHYSGANMLEADRPPEAPRPAPLRLASDWFRKHASFDLLTLDEIAAAVNARPQSIRLPSFQRDAAWDWADIELLWDSVLRGYPLGSLLFARPLPGQGLAIRELRRHREAAATETEAANGSDTLILLDGQQRASAISIGLRPWSAGVETRLWLDLFLPKHDRNGFRLCSLTLPWGPGASVAQKARARERLEKQLPEGCAALGLTWPATARVPVPFAELVAYVRAGRFSEWPSLVPAALRDQTDQVTPEQAANWQGAIERISAFRVPAILLATLPSVDDLAKTFERLNTAGVDMGQEELFFSGIKLRWPQAHDLVWDVYSDRETGRFLAPTKIVHLAVRLAATTEPGSDRDIVPMDLNTFRTHIEPEGGNALLRTVAVYLEPRFQGHVGRLCEVLRSARSALSYRPDQHHDPGFPAPMLASFTAHLWHILAAWLDRHETVDPESRAEMLRFASAVHFFARPFASSLSKQLFVEARNTSGPFPGRKLWEILAEGGDRAVLVGIPTPSSFTRDLRKEGEQHRALFGHENDLVVWTQRAHVQRWFSDYDPTLYTGRGAEKPYDLDHIVAWAQFDQRSSRNVTPAVRFNAVRHGVLPSSGNLRLWPKSENRRDQDAPLADKCLLGPAEAPIPADSYLRLLGLTTFGEVRRASCIPEEDVDLWRAAAPGGIDRHDWSSAERLDAFDRAVFNRRVWMYQALYNALDLGAWVEA